MGHTIPQQHIFNRNALKCPSKAVLLVSSWSRVVKEVICNANLIVFPKTYNPKGWNMEDVQMAMPVPSHGTWQACKQVFTGCHKEDTDTAYM